MAYDEYIRKAIITGRSYDDLPQRIKNVVSLGEWRQR
jgi:hypothetical protein